jgi:hypothetical protein
VAVSSGKTSLGSEKKKQIKSELKERFKLVELAGFV